MKTAYATIMMYADLAESAGERTQLACDLANRFDAHLIGIATQALPPVYVAGAIVDTRRFDEEYEALRSLLAARQIEFMRRVDGVKNLADWRSGLVSPTHFVAEQSRAADLIITGRDRSSESDYYSLDPGGLILGAGRPVLIVPKGIASLGAGTVTIAWKESREARRALQDSLPFLHDAARVVIVEVCESGTEPESKAHLHDVADYLLRHGIKAGVECVRSKRATVADDLIEFSEVHHAELIVAGAYGHSRLGEWMFGGVTRDLLKRSPICCLLSH